MQVYSFMSMVSAVLYYVADTCVLSGEDVLMYSGSVCRYGWDVWQQTYTTGSIQCLALFTEPCNRWQAADDVISRHYTRNNARL